MGPDERNNASSNNAHGMGNPSFQLEAFDKVDNFAVSAPPLAYPV